MSLFPSGFDPHSTIFNAHRVAEGELYLVRAHAVMSVR